MTDVERILEKLDEVLVLVKTLRPAPHPIEPVHIDVGHDSYALVRRRRVVVPWGEVDVPVWDRLPNHQPVGEFAFLEDGTLWVHMGHDVEGIARWMRTEAVTR